MTPFLLSCVQQSRMDFLWTRDVDIRVQNLSLAHHSASGSFLFDFFAFFAFFFFLSLLLSKGVFDRRRTVLKSLPSNPPFHSGAATKFCSLRSCFCAYVLSCVRLSRPMHSRNGVVLFHVTIRSVVLLV